MLFGSAEMLDIIVLGCTKAERDPRSVLSRSTYHFLIAFVSNCLILKVHIFPSI